jgi:hypothetical protein
MELFISASSREFYRTQSDPALMANLARRSGGISGTSDSLEAVVQSLDLSPDQVILEREYSLAHGILSLVFLVGILAAEWLIRRRRGMV